MAKPFKKALTISTCLLVAVALTIGAVAWFSGYKVIGNMGFQTGSNSKLPEMKMWMYTSTNDNAGPEGWVPQTIGKDTERNEYMTIPSVEKNANGSGYVMKSLHFGKVDNLVTLKSDNKIMFRLYFDETMLNNPDGIIHYVAFTLAYNTAGYSYVDDGGKTPSVLDSIHLLKMDSDTDENLKLNRNPDPDGTPSYVLEFNENNPAAMQFLQIRYAVSTELYAPYEDLGFVGATETTDEDGQVTTTYDTEDVLSLSAPVPINCGSAGAYKKTKDENGELVNVTDEDGNPVPICSACASDPSTCGKMQLSATDLAKVANLNSDGKTYTMKDGGFYVYIEMAPKLDAFGMQENILDYFVPAYMFFDTKMDVEIG